MAMSNRLSPGALLVTFLLPGMALAAPVLGPEIQVNVSTMDVQMNPQVAVFPDGGFIVAWVVQPKASPGAARTTGVHARLFAANGAPASGEFLLVSPGNVIALDGLVATSDDGFAAVWDSYGKPAGDGPGVVQQVEVQMFERSGSPSTRAALAHLPSRFDRYSGVVTATAEGRVVVAWAADVGYQTSIGYYNNAAARIFSARLAPLTGELLLSMGSGVDGSGPFPDAIALAPDGSLTAALTYYGDSINVFAVRVAQSGKALPVDPLYPDAETSYDASLAMKPDGSFAAVWDEQTPAFPWLLPLRPEPPGPIHGRLFDADGTAEGPDAFQVNRRAPGQRTLPKIVWQPAGGYITIWEDESGQDGDGTGIFGRFLSANGAPAGGDFRVNLTTAGNQSSPALAAGPKATAVAVWLSGTATAVYARLITLP
jgi:hypothetical protein